MPAMYIGAACFLAGAERDARHSNLDEPLVPPPLDRPERYQDDGQAGRRSQFILPFCVLPGTDAGGVTASSATSSRFKAGYTRLPQPS